MTNLQLTGHFNLAEFERSATAQAYGIDNSCPRQYIPVLRQLCQTILEPLRAFVNSNRDAPVGKSSAPAPAPAPASVSASVSAPVSEEIPIVISSGYRCNALNIKVGGVYASQHTIGEAADIQIPKTTYSEWGESVPHTDKEILNRWFDWIVDNTDFDQAIVETANGKDFWIHVSCRKNASKNRHQVLRMTNGTPVSETRSSTYRGV